MINSHAQRQRGWTLEEGENRQQDRSLPQRAIERLYPQGIEGDAETHSQILGRVQEIL